MNPDGVTVDLDERETLFALLAFSIAGGWLQHTGYDAHAAEVGKVQNKVAGAHDDALAGDDTQTGGDGA